MMNRYVLLLCMLVCAADTIGAQKDTTIVKVRQSFESTDLKAEPAALLLTFPYQTAATYAVDGGIAIERESANNRFFGKLIAEYHRNTLIDKEQNNGQFGIAIERYSANFKSILNGTAKHVRDVVASKGSFLHTLEIGPFPSTQNGLSHRFGGPKNHLLLIVPSVGYEYQNTFDAKTEKRDSLRGNMLRGMGKAKVSLTFNKRIVVGGPKIDTTKFYEDSLGTFVLTQKELFRIDSTQTNVVPAVQFSLNGAMRYDIINTTQTPDGWHPYLQISADYILTRSAELDPRLSIGLSFVTGENPAQGLARQKYWLLALKFTL